MNPVQKYYKKALCAVFEQIPRGHLIAAACLSAGLIFSLLLPADQTLDTSTDDNGLANDNLLQQEILADIDKQEQIAFVDLILAQTTINSILEASGIKSIANTQEPQQPNWKELTVKSGDNLSSIFARAGLSDRDIYELFDGNKKTKDLRSIIPGQKMAFLIGNDGSLQELKYVKNNLESLIFIRSKNGYTNQEITLKPEIRRTFREGTINSSLFVSAKQAGIPTNLTMDMANIFGYDIDFALDIQKGDSFKVIFEEHYLEDKKIGTGAILSAEFTNAGKTFRAVRYTSKDGTTRYYAADGKGMNKAFLRTPVDFSRISSSFSLSRRHPVLNTIRAHKGTDYAAATGTPIRATGDGKVIFAGRQGGYGNLIIIQHGQGYETRYGHMNSFAKGISTGSRVTQGQIIGAVGMTGLASGPHLHYEFHVSGQVRDPVTVQLPQSIGIAANEKERFLASTQNLVAQLDELSRNSRMATAEGSTKSN